MSSKIDNTWLKEINKDGSSLVVYAGLERGDLILAAAQLLASAGFSIILIDNSITLDIWDLYNDSSNSAIAKDGPLVIRHDAMLKKRIQDVDVVITYVGCNIMQLPTFADYYIAGVSEHQSTIRTARVALPQYAKSQKLFIFRDENALSVEKLAGYINAPENSEWIEAVLEPDEISAWSAYTRSKTNKFIQHYDSSREALIRIMSLILGNSDMNDKKTRKEAQLIAKDIFMKYKNI